MTTTPARSDVADSHRVANQPAVAAHRLTVRLGRRDVLTDVDLVVPTGSWTCVVGPNGAGKSTLLRAIAGLVEASGSMLVAGQPIGRLHPRARARLTAYAPQEPMLPGDMVVLDYVLVGRTAHLGRLAVETSHDHDVARGALAALDLVGFESRPLGQLSGGERQRVVLARSIAQESPLLLLDEPTSALDLGHQQAAFELVDRLRIERGLTIVSAMHDLNVASQFADTIVLLTAGTVAASGRPADVLTADTIASRFGATVEVRVEPDGRVVVVPVRRRSP